MNVDIEIGNAPELNENVDLMTLIQPLKLEESFSRLNRRIVEETQKVLELPCNEDTYKHVKKVRAAMNKEAAAIDEQYKSIKAEALKPWEDLNTKYRLKVKEPLEKCDKELKDKISSVENGIKAEKEKVCREYYTEKAQAEGVNNIPFERMNLKIGLSDTISSLKKFITHWIDGKRKDLSAISTLENSDEILAEYYKTLNASEAAITVSKRHEAIKKAKEEKEKYAQQQSAETEHVENVITAAKEAVQANEPEKPKLYLTKFTVKGTKEQLIRLKEFMQKEGILWEN